MWITLKVIQQKLIKIYNNPLLRNLLKVYIKTKHLLIKDKKKSNAKKDMLGVALHGCALIFSKKYYKRYHDVFYNETFLYHEEEFLYYRCMHDKLTSLYSPKIELIHKEGQSLNKKYSENYKKNIFRNKEILKSLELLEKTYKKGGLI